MITRDEMTAQASSMDYARLIGVIEFFTKYPPTDAEESQWLQVIQAEKLRRER